MPRSIMGRQIGRLVSLLSILTVVLMLLAILPTPAFAQDPAPFVTCSGPDCNICKLVESVSNIISFTITLAVILATIILAYGGFKLVFSKGDPGAISQAKTFLINTVIGVILILAAWTLVDTLMKVLVRDDINNFGAWNKIDPKLCRGQNESGEAVRKLPSVGSNENDLQFEEGDGTATITVVNQYGPGGVYALEGPEPVSGGVVAADADGSFTYNAGIQAQLPHASRALSSMLNCIANRVPANVGRISSISDSRIVSGEKTFAQCVTGGCAHARNSRHYGGANHTGSSYAVDFGDEEHVATLCAAANACGRVRSCGVHNGNHVHLELYYPDGT